MGKTSSYGTPMVGAFSEAQQLFVNGGRNVKGRWRKISFDPMAVELGLKGYRGFK